MPSSRGSSRPRDRTACRALQADSLPSEPPRTTANTQNCNIRLLVTYPLFVWNSNRTAGLVSMVYLATLPHRNHSFSEMRETETWKEQSTKDLLLLPPPNSQIQLRSSRLSSQGPCLSVAPTVILSSLPKAKTTTITKQAMICMKGQKLSGETETRNCFERSRESVWVQCGRNISAPSPQKQRPKKREGI